MYQYGIRGTHRPFPSKPMRIFGGDTETIKGDPDTLQLVSEGEEFFERVDASTIFPRLVHWIKPRLLDKGLNVVFFHNLKFDLTIIFKLWQEAIYNQYNDIRLTAHGWDVRLLYGRVNTAWLKEDLGYWCSGKIKGERCGSLPKEAVLFKGEAAYCSNPAHQDTAGRRVFPAVKRKYGARFVLMDSAAFCPPGAKSLQAALKIYGVPYRKMAAPEGLGKRRLDTVYFKDYALNDARAEEALGQAIVALHKEYDIPPCVSLPQMAGKILRHHFFRPDEALAYPPPEAVKAAEFSYHAGKNGMYVERGYYPDVYEYDINSAFPKAMKDLPQMVRGRYVRARRFKPGAGLWCLRGERIGGKYPVVFDHAFKPISGRFEGVWVTGYEVECLLGNPDYRFKIQSGWRWIPNKRYGHSPLAEFVDRFWELKSTAPKGPKRDTYKNILNSLYGKFAACVEKRPVLDTREGRIPYDGVWDVATGVVEASVKRFQAGAMYHPFIASQITGAVRKTLFHLERSGHAFHAATDSIKSKLKLPTDEALGGIKEEVFGGCYLFRNKLYLHFAKDASRCGHDLKAGWLYVPGRLESTLEEVGDAFETGIHRATERRTGERRFGKIFDRGEHLCKYGLHGFKGSVFELYAARERLLAEGHYTYRYEHMTGLREAFRRGETVSDMVEREERLALVR